MSLLKRFTNRFRRNQRVYVFFICFIIAALFWFLLVLTKEYTSSLKVKVTYINFPSGLIPVTRLPEKFVLGIKASGYNLISMNENSELNIDVDAVIRPEQGVQKISSRMLTRDLDQQLGNDVSITSIQPDTLVFDLSFATPITLPVRASLNVTFDKQYDSVALQLSPDSVTANMPVSYLGTIRYIETENVKAGSLRASLRKKVKLIIPEGVTLDTAETEVFLQVEKFTEGTAQVPVKLVNVPEGLAIKIYPDIVTVKYLVALSQYAGIKPDMFTVTANASSASSDSDEKLEITVVASPPGVRSVSCQPQQVDFILKK